MSKVIDTFFGNEEFPVEWKNEEEKKLHWFYDDLHCPHPISPLYYDVGGWWGPTCEYMYRRFGAPIGKQWIAKKVNNYVYTAIVPRDESENLEQLGKYYSTVMPIYADTFLDKWYNEYIPQIEEDHKVLDEYPYESASLPELLVFMEDALDMQEKHFRIHWILNLAQLQASLEFQAAYKEAIGEIDDDNIGKILVSTDDRNWDSLKALWEMKEYIKDNKHLSEFFKNNKVEEIMEKIEQVEGSDELLEMIEDYKDEFGYKAIYTHEYIYPTWKEDPTPIYETLKNYLEIDYDFYEAYNNTKETREKAIEEMFSRVKDEDMKKTLKEKLDLASKMTPLTPNHHFYIDQGTYARMRIMFKKIGEKLVEAGVLDDSEDIFMLEYEEIRAIAVDPDAFDVKALVKERRESLEKSKEIEPREWIGTITEWSLYEEPYKTLWGWPAKYEIGGQKESKNELKGLPASPGVVEGVARFVTSPAEFNKIQKGDILVCKMTNPAWVVCFTKISGLVTDTGGALSHPAVVSREFGIPCVVGTSRATRTIKSGMRVRVDGNKGKVEILG